MLDVLLTTLLPFDPGTHSFILLLQLNPSQGHRGSAANPSSHQAKAKFRAINHSHIDSTGQLEVYPEYLKEIFIIIKHEPNMRLNLNNIFAGEKH